MCDILGIIPCNHRKALTYKGSVFLLSKMKKIFDYYEIDERGNVYNLNFKGSGKRRKVKPRQNSKGYWRVGLMTNGKQISYNVHRLVAREYIGSVKGKLVDHIDKNKDNNHYSNLRILNVTESNHNRSFGKNRNIRKHRKLWVVTIKYYGNVYRNSFKTKKEAYENRNIMLKKLHPTLVKL